MQNMGSIASNQNLTQQCTITETLHIHLHESKITPRGAGHQPNMAAPISNAIIFEHIYRYNIDQFLKRKGCVSKQQPQINYVIMVLLTHH